LLNKKLHEGGRAVSHERETIAKEKTPQPRGGKKKTQGGTIKFEKGEYFIHQGSVRRLKEGKDFCSTIQGGREKIFNFFPRNMTDYRKKGELTYEEKESSKSRAKSRAKNWESYSCKARPGRGKRNIKKKWGEGYENPEHLLEVDAARVVHLEKETAWEKGGKIGRLQRFTPKEATLTKTTEKKKCFRVKAILKRKKEKDGGGLEAIIRQKRVTIVVQVSSGEEARGTEKETVFTWQKEESFKKRLLTSKEGEGGRKVEEPIKRSRVDKSFNHYASSTVTKRKGNHVRVI